MMGFSQSSAARISASKKEGPAAGVSGKWVIATVATVLYDELYTLNTQVENDRLNIIGDGPEVKFVTVRLDGPYIISHNMQYVSQVATHELGFA